MKSKFVIVLLTAVLFNAITSGIFSSAIGVSHGVMFTIQMGLSLIPMAPAGCLCAGLNKEIWIPEIIEKFYADDTFVSYAKDLDAWVDNDKLNLQEAGVDPKVYIDNEIYPIPIAVRSDIPHEILLKRFDTENTVHVNAVDIEESAQKRLSVIEGHRNSLRQKFGRLAAFNWAPASDSETTPVISTSGAVNKRGHKSLTYEDLLDLEGRFNELEIPLADRMLVLCAQHGTDLRKQDLTLYKTIYGENKLFSFNVLHSGMTPTYNGTTGVKNAWGAAAAATDAYASLAYYKQAVGRARGTVDMYARLKDPEYRGDVIGFNMRGVATPITGKHIGAIYSKKA